MKQMVFLRFDAAGFRVDRTAPHDPFIPVLDVIETVVAGGTLSGLNAAREGWQLRPCVADAHC